MKKGVDNETDERTERKKNSRTAQRSGEQGNCTLSRPRKTWIKDPFKRRLLDVGRARKIGMNGVREGWSPSFGRCSREDKERSKRPRTRNIILHRDK